jgi:hypothetical protein
MKAPPCKPLLSEHPLEVIELFKLLNVTECQPRALGMKISGALITQKEVCRKWKIVCKIYN